MKARIALLATIVSIAAVFPGMAYDLATWGVTGRPTAIAVVHHPGGGSDTFVTLASITAQSTLAVSTPFRCDTSWVDCSNYILGTCNKSTLTATQTGPEGTTTTATTSCDVPNYADCWHFGGFLSPALVATHQERQYGCNF